MRRKIVQIDESKCDGCGQCIPSCAEGAIALVDGKARLSGDALCDGLGACLGECPQGAITVVEREAAPFDEVAVHTHLAARAAPVPRPPLQLVTARAAQPAAPAMPLAAATARPRLSVVSNDAPAPGGCPGSRSTTLPRRGGPAATPSAGESRLGHWPVQLHLVNPGAPWLRGADLLVAADCVPFAYARFHDELLAGRAVVIGCPKLDDLAAYGDKLAAIFRTAAPRSVTVVRMEVPCCGGISTAARQALAAAAVAVPFRDVVIGIDGTLRG
ncbi:MAG TPA: 4Fe-4S binding protein [Anaeromyxobacteraceae bacterium]|nr:4Fe-4S binding protein [Anaeromyxobacteraceae bacterium]